VQSVVEVEHVAARCASHAHAHVLLVLQQYAQRFDETNDSLLCVLLLLLLRSYAGDRPSLRVARYVRPVRLQ